MTTAKEEFESLWKKKAEFELKFEFLDGISRNKLQLNKTLLETFVVCIIFGLFMPIPFLICIYKNLLKQSKWEYKYNVRWKIFKLLICIYRFFISISLVRDKCVWNMVKHYIMKFNYLLFLSWNLMLLNSMHGSVKTSINGD